jgi:SAM-dependent methyltransferase
VSADRLLTKDTIIKKLPKLWREEMQSDPESATSANSYSWIMKANLTSQFLLPDCKIILNVGCGIGRELFHLRGNAIGIDISMKSIKLARQVSKSEVICADAHHLPFRKDVFDGITSAEVIEHLKSPAQALLEMAYVLRSAGKLVLQTPNKGITLGRIISEMYGHEHEFTTHELLKFLTIAGFSIVKVTGSTIPYIPSTSRLTKINENKFFLLVWKFLNKHFKLVTWDIIVYCKKQRNR